MLPQSHQLTQLASKLSTRSSDPSHDEEIASQDSLDNIVVGEDEFNQSGEDLDSMEMSLGCHFEGAQDQIQQQENDDDDEEEEVEYENQVNRKDGRAATSSKNGSATKVEKQGSDSRIQSLVLSTSDSGFFEEESNVILKKISLKRKSIFSLVPRAEYMQSLKLKSSSSNLKSKMNQSKQQCGSNSNNKSSSLVGAQQQFKREILNYSRREKSLEELSKKFLSLFLDKEESLLSLDKITNQLGVERRRIYDIINILESLQLVSRKGKNNYKWNGFQKIYQTINSYDSVNYRRQSQQFELEDVDECLDEDGDDDEEAGGSKREKSLEMLSIGFLKLFLHWKPTMTLEESARKLSSRNIDDHKIKTKIRRLYDIANVFKSLGLIKKTALADTKKPAFQWIGMNGLDTFADQILLDKKQSQKDDCMESEEEFEQHFSAKSCDAATANPSTEEPSLKKKRCTKPQLKKSFILQQQIKEEQSRQLRKQEEAAAAQFASNTVTAQNQFELVPIPTLHQQTSNLSNISCDSQAANANAVTANPTSAPQNLISDQSFEMLASTLQQNLLLNQFASLTSNNNNTMFNQLMMKYLSDMLNGYVNNLITPSNNNNSMSNSLIGNLLNNNNNNNSFAEPLLESCRNSGQKAQLNCVNVQSHADNFETAKKANSMNTNSNNNNTNLNDENVRVSTANKSFKKTSSFQPSMNSSSSLTNNLKTPILKKTFTIIQPKIDEKVCNPTPPTSTKRTGFSACIQPSKLFNEAGAIMSNSSSNSLSNSSKISDSKSFGTLNNNNSNGFSALSDKTNRMSSFSKSSIIPRSLLTQQLQQQQQKEIRKLTFDCASPFTSENKDSISNKANSLTTRTSGF